MKYALIGCGKIGSNHIKAAIENRLEIAAVCDVRHESMENLLEKYGLEGDESIRRYTDYREMLEKEKPQIAAIATESGSHAKIALDCISSGINVIIEKPIAMSMADADAIVSAAKKYNVKAGVCHTVRFNPAVQAVRRALEEGRFGRLSHGCVHVRWNRNAGYYEQAPWRGTWEHDGGCLMNQCIHGIDLLLWMMGGEAEEVYAQTARRFHDYLECEDVGVAVVRFRNGAVGTIEGTVNVFPKNLEESLYIFGETGTVKIGGRSADSIEVWQFADQRPYDGETLAAGGGHTALYADMIDSVQNGHAPYIDAEAGRRALEAVLGIYKSAADGAPVKFPLKDVACTDFKGRFDRAQNE